MTSFGTRPVFVERQSAAKCELLYVYLAGVELGGVKVVKLHRFSANSDFDSDVDSDVENRCHPRIGQNHCVYHARPSVQYKDEVRLLVLAATFRKPARDEGKTNSTHSSALVGIQLWLGGFLTLCFGNYSQRREQHDVGNGSSRCRMAKDRGQGKGGVEGGGNGFVGGG
ncbi:hypothetical protein B0H17DRAFT_1186311 [Mycena rosella]|uniref:Uncharacterized protein n=1 Tax=Mycena rosella TaxID=1033263 RepID=A0AAD7CMP2_MYCRO|nr:hypothetical protein B0H17DRAFT_1186311 [Mycena rosella]